MNFAIEVTTTLRRVLDEKEYDMCVQSLTDLDNFIKKGQWSKIMNDIYNFYDEREKYSSAQEFIDYGNNMKSVSSHWFAEEKERLDENSKYPKTINPIYFTFLIRMFYSSLK